MLTDEQQKAAERFRDAVTEYITAMYGNEVGKGNYFLEIKDDAGECSIEVTGLHGGGCVFSNVYDRIDHYEDGDVWKSWRSLEDRPAD